MAESLKQKTFNGVSWSIIERFSVQGFNFLLQIILARLLLPSDFGVIALMTVFLQLSQVLIDSGFASALIQKQDCTEDDYNTVFYCNLVISLILYAVLFVCSPIISIFYEQSSITLLLRVLSLSIVFNALTIVHRTKLVKDVDFISIAKVTFASSFVSGIIAIILAYWGVGVWALVIQMLLNSIFIILLFNKITRWIPKKSFSTRSFKELFNFGSKLLVTNLINTLYRNLYTIIIGKRFSTADLGCFNRADQFAMFPSNNIASIILRVTYPVLSKIQDDKDGLRYAYRMIIKFSSYVIFPLMIGLVSLANPLVIALLTDKWSFVIPMLQILCFDWMLDHISGINLNLLYVKKHSDWALRLEIIKKVIAVTILFISLPFGLLFLCYGRVIYSVIATVMNTYYTKRLIDLSFWDQICDILPYLVASILMGICSYGATLCVSTPVSKLILGIIAGIISYGIMSILFFRPIVREIYSYFKSKI